MTARRLAEQERQELADLLAELTLGEWNTASLCVGWRVRDVVAHLFSYEELGLPQIVGLGLIGRFDPARINDLALAPIRDMPPALLVAAARTHLVPRRLTGGLGGGRALLETLVHQQDIRRPLHRSRTIAEEGLRTALDLALRSPTGRARRRGRSLRLVATDIDWSLGAGPEVRGPAEALLMSVTGRREALDDLSGPGLAQLRARLVAA